MKLKDRLKKLWNKGNEEDEANPWIFASYILCSKFGWDYHTLKKQPLPFIFNMLNMMEYETKVREKQQDETKDNNSKSKSFMKFRNKKGK